MGSKLPKLEIVYFCQMIVVYVIIVTSIVNLSLQNGKNELWITLLVLFVDETIEFQHFSIVFLQLFSAEVFQDVAARTVSISLSNDMNTEGSAGIAVFCLDRTGPCSISLDSDLRNFSTQWVSERKPTTHASNTS
jgi:hypothetical protein